MKGAKELAKYFREEAERQFGYFGAEERRSVLSDTIAHLDAKAAIDSAVPGEVGEIAAAHAEHRGHFRCDQMPDSIVRVDTLLVIVQRQAADLTAARAEVERLKAALQAHNPGLRAALSREESAHLATLAELDEARVKAAALAQENARLINEVGELDATAREQRQRAEVLARGLAAYRVGGFTAGQVWENEEGKAVK